MMIMYKDNVFSKALTLIGKLQHKYGFKPKFYNIISPCSVFNSDLPTILEEEILPVIEEPIPRDAKDGEWCFVSSSGDVHRLPKTMIFLGREECDIEIQGQCVDKRHAVVTFDHYLCRFKIKDLSTADGTFVNEERIPEQEYVILEPDDCVRLGQDETLTFKMERLEDNHQENEREMIFSDHNNDQPLWASPDSGGSQDLQSSLMAECQGCIEKQHIEDTCEESSHESEPLYCQHLNNFDRSYSQDSIASYSLGYNTWPRKRVKERKNVKELFLIMNEERSRQMEGLIDQPLSRVSHGTGAQMNILPNELELVKKGTPLYGQPEWWGEGSDLRERLLHLDSNTMDKSSSKPDAEISYIDSSTDVSKTNEKDTDSQHIVAKHDPVPTTKHTPEGVTHMAFTVDFGDDSKPHMEGSRSLRDFMPSKLRKSFRERLKKADDKEHQEKTQEKLSTSSKSSSKEKLTLTSSKEIFSPEKTPPATILQGRAQSEGRDVSPTQHSKLEELWNSANLTADSAVNKRQKMMNKTSAPKSMDEDNLDSSLTKAIKPTSFKKRAPIASSQFKTKSLACAQKSVSQEILDSTVSCKTDTTAYLIEKMFENISTNNVDSLNFTNSSITEYQMYHEAKKFDIELSNKKVRKSKLEKEKLDKNVWIKEVAVSISKKSIEPETQKHYDDKASDTGTYTIEEERDSKVENEARQNIDKVFGVDQISLDFSENLLDDLKGTMKKPGKHKQGELTLNLQNINLELEEIEKLEKLRSRQSMGDSMVTELGSAEPRECFRREENLSSPIDAPEWMSEWTALINQKSPKDNMNLSSPSSSTSDVSDSKSGKGPNDYIHKRPGTGRRLPALPPSATNEISENIVTKEDSPVTSKCDLSINFVQPGVQSLRQRVQKVSSLMPDQYEDNDSEHLSLTKYETNLENSTVTSHRQACSKTSLDTELLLRDTEIVMAAIEKKVGSKATLDAKQRRAVNISDNNNAKRNFVISNELSYVHSISHNVVKNDSPWYGENTGDSVNNGALHYGVNTVESVIVLDDSVDLESDTSNAVALVNGDKDFVNPSLYKGPRSVLGNAKLKLTEPLPSKPSISMNGAKSSEKVKICSPDDVSLVSDVFSEVIGDVVSAQTYDIDTPETHFVRQDSQGKGQMSMTRPNRAFTLRRARADSEDVLDSARSSSIFSVASISSKTPKAAGSMTNLQRSSSIGVVQKPRRTMSGILAEPPDTTCSKESLGPQILQKNRDNINANFNRADVRHSVRVNRSLSIPTRQPNSSLAAIKSNQKLSDGTPSSSIQHSKSLHVTGVNVVTTREKTSSKQSIRTTSPKSAERNAWKRRKEYDPRKAVADSKSKGHASKQGSHFNKSNIVVRSSSFSNTKDLKINTQKDKSASSLDDCSHSRDISDVFNDSLRRGFVPYSVRSLVSSKVSNSSDDEIERSARSSSQSSQASTMNRHFKPTCPPQLNSAFTQPPHETPPLSVCKPTSRSRSVTRRSRARITPKTPSTPLPNSITGSLQRMSFNHLELYQKAPGNKRNFSTESSHKIPESYDSLIVASIYQLSLKLKTQTDKTLEKLRVTDVIENGLDSPLDELENQSVSSEIPAYKSANQELAGVLKNLQRLEKHIKIMNKVLFPDDEMSPDTSKEKNKYLQEIERIKNELAGFQPINTPCEDVWKHVDTASVESDCEEIDQSFTEIL